MSKATGIDPCAHCGTPKAECVRMVVALSLTGCCPPCDFGPQHESEAGMWEDYIYESPIPLERT